MESLTQIPYIRSINHQKIFYQLLEAKNQCQKFTQWEDPLDVGVKSNVAWQTNKQNPNQFIGILHSNPLHSV